MQHPELDRLQSKDRMRQLRNWCLGLGLIASTSAMVALGTAIGNPKAWASAYHALAAAGGLRWLTFPLLGLGAVLLIAAIVLTLVSEKQ